VKYAGGGRLTAAWREWGRFEAAKMFAAGTDDAEVAVRSRALSGLVAVGWGQLPAMGSPLLIPTRHADVR
jgi:hypothetical protein